MRRQHMNLKRMIRIGNSFFALAGAVLIAGCGGGGTDATASALQVAAALAHSETVALQRRTESGLVRGHRDAATQTLAWLGLPYAKPPVGDLRWKPPLPPESWTAPRDASQFGPSCAQGGRYFSPPPGNAPFGLSVRDGFGKPVGSEDCLTLNVWRPAASDGKLPVLFFIHGGSNISGYSADPIYHGARLAQQANAVVVTINYRLGLFGWLDMKQLKTGEPIEDSGNFGLLDQIQALHYVKANVEAFGGDPGNVTILGQSAGAVNVWSLVVSPLTEGLFHKAVSMSGGIVSTPRLQGLSYSHRLLKSLLVDDGTVADDAAAESWIVDKSHETAAAYLRGKSSQEILAVSLAHSGLKEAPAMFPDGAVVPLNPHLAITQGNYRKVPMLASNTREEVKLLGAAFGAFKPSDYDRFTMEYNFDPDASPTLTEADLLYSRLLPVDRPATGWNALSDLATQGAFLAGISTSMAALATQQPDQMWYLRFDWAQQPTPFNTVYGAAHAMDLPFWFGNFGRSSFSFGYSKANRLGREQLSSAMIRTLASFARTGNPNHEGLGVAWPNWPATLVFDADLAQARIWLE
ncbi:MAG: carboxylesterase [Comamonadaceae bacterium]|nr:MAG: carboxylesterase [Comamonadaceae bacterium]